MTPCLASHSSSWLKPAELLLNFLWRSLELRNKATSKVRLAMSMPKISIVCLRGDKESACSGRPCEYKLIFFGRGIRYRPTFMNKAEGREPVFRSGSKAAGRYSTSSFLQIQAPLDYLNSKNISSCQCCWGT